jgi:hypothetical protein
MIISPAPYEFIIDKFLTKELTIICYVYRFILPHKGALTSRGKINF